MESPYWSWIGLRLLEAIVAASGSSDAKDILTSYRNTVYSKRLVKVLPSVPNKEVKDTYYSKIVSKIDKDIEKITVSDLLEFQSELETVIMDIKTGTCALACIKEGCIETEWIIPTHCIDHAYNSACLDRHKLHTLNVEYLQVGTCKIYDPSIFLSSKITTAEIPLPAKAGKMHTYTRNYVHMYL